jgi:transposase-like protein
VVPFYSALDSKGKVVPRVVPDVKKATILPIVGEVLPPRTTIYTDDHATYDALRWMGQSHRHGVVNHSKGFRDGDAHTNTIDGSGKTGNQGSLLSGRLAVPAIIFERVRLPLQPPQGHAPDVFFARRADRDAGLPFRAGRKAFGST